jgi:hypothetical protein
MRAASAAFKAQLKADPNFTQTVIATIPGEGLLDLKLASGANVASSAGQGPRSSVNNLSVVSFDVQARELWGLLQRPGATFDIDIGQRVSARRIESVPVFHGYAAQGSTRIVESAVSLSLVDPWAWVEGVPYTEPFPIVGEAGRADVIASIVVAVLPAVEVVIGDQGGATCMEGVVLNESRTQTISRLASEGRLDVYFDAAGRLIIRKMPEVDLSSVPVDTLTTGPAGTILAGSGVRSRDFGRIYNAVAVIPDHPDATWSTVTVRLADTSNYLHENFIGFRPFPLRSTTIGTAEEAAEAGEAQLQRVLKVTETADVSLVANPLLEVGDPVDIASLRTSTDPGFAKTYLLQSMSIDLESGQSAARGTDAALYETEVVV